MPADAGDMNLILTYGFHLMRTGGNGLTIFAGQFYSGKMPPPLADVVVVFESPAFASIPFRYRSSSVTNARRAFPMFTTSFGAHFYLGAMPRGQVIDVTVKLMQCVRGSWPLCNQFEGNLVPYVDYDMTNNTRTIRIVAP